MFGKFRDNNDPLPRPPRNPDQGLPNMQKSAADFGFPADAKPSASPSSGPLATYDRLGQTLVATPTVATLSGAVDKPLIVPVIFLRLAE